MSASPLDPRVLRILMDIAARVSVLEASGEVGCAQFRELITKIDKLADENRQWRRHVERLVHEKEVLLQAQGRFCYLHHDERQELQRARNMEMRAEVDRLVGLDQEDIARALREMNS